MRLLNLGFPSVASRTATERVNSIKVALRHISLAERICRQLMRNLKNVKEAAMKFEENLTQKFPVFGATKSCE